MIRSSILGLISLLVVIGCDQSSTAVKQGKSDGSAADKQSAEEVRVISPAIAAKLVPDANNKVHLTDDEWKQILTAEEYVILREEGTEPAFKNAYHDNHASGTYVCKGCSQLLFDSEKKFDSGTGWPSFWQPVAGSAVIETSDNDPAFPRVEVKCSRCEGHLGHVFRDGPKPTGLRYCMDSASLHFVSR